MAKLNIDVTGREGLVSSYQGDLNDTTAQPHLRYIGGEVQLAEGIYDPLKINGYLSPVNNTYTDLTDSATDSIVAREYDAINDVLYFAEDGPYMQKYDGFTDTTGTTTQMGSTSVDARYDTEIYELYGNPTLYYLNHYQSPNGPGMVLGIWSLDPAKGQVLIDSNADNFSNDTMEYIGAGDNHKLAQKFDTSTFRGLTVTAIRLGLQNLRTPTTDVPSFTLKVGIQTDNAGRPSGTYVANAELTYTNAEISALIQDYYDDVYFVFPTAPTLSASTTYHIVVEATVFGDLGDDDTIGWLRTDGGTSLYAAGQAQQYPSGGPWANADGATNESFDFSIYARYDSTLITPAGLSGEHSYTQNPDQAFLHKSDNGLLYIFADNYVHKFDGSVTGGIEGTFTEEVLSFPSYIDLVDALSTQSLMYIGIQGKGSESSADKTFESDVMGLYVWDRQSTVLNIQSFIPCYGARELKKIFLTADGDLRVMTIGEDGFTEIRGIQDGRLVVLKRLGRKAYPNYRDGFDTLNNLIVWFGADGIIYGLGRVYGGEESVFKLGDMTAEVSGTLTAGTILAGNYETTQARQGVYLTWSDSNGVTISKWYPHGDGTISSVEQKGHIGNVYTPVKQFGTLAQINYIRVYCRPTTSSGSTVIANIKTYLNQSSTPDSNKEITQKMASDGFFYLPIGKKSVHAIQFEIEFSTTQTLGDDDFNPMFIEIDYEPTGKKK